MKSSLFFNESSLDYNQQGEHLLFPLLIVVFIFGIYMLSSTAPNKSQWTYDQNISSAATSSKTESKRIVDIIYSCSFKSILEKGRDCQ